jgi:hypothetical protein
MMSAFSMAVTVVNSSSDGQIILTHLPLLGSAIAMVVFCPSLLRYHFSNGSVQPVATVYSETVITLDLLVAARHCTGHLT